MSSKLGTEKSIISELKSIENVKETHYFIWTSGCPEISECTLAISPLLKVRSHL